MALPQAEALLDNVFWHALSGPQSHLSLGSHEARRFAPGLPPIIAFANNTRPRFDALAAVCPPGERFYCGGWAGPVPAGWQIEAEKTMGKMVWGQAAPTADAAPNAQPLGPEHLEQALALVELTQPGPFGPRSFELGTYLGQFEGQRLIAMAGERVQAGPLREVSAVCTHPDFQGQGIATGLMLTLIRQQMQRGETPFLHVMSDNAGACFAYRRMGFAEHLTAPVRVVSRR